MIPGFVKVDPHEFYTEVWSRIQSQVEAVQSNLPKIKLGEESILVVHWGYKVPDTGEVVVLAVTRSEPKKVDEHWVAPSLFKS